MSVNPSSNVYVSELDLSQVVSNASTTAAAITFASSKGRAGRYFVADTKTFIREYGTPNPQVSYGHYQALQFLSEGTALWVARAIGNGALYAGSVLQKRATQDTYNIMYQNYPLANPTSFNPTLTINGSTSQTDNLAYFYAYGPGSYASNIQVEIVSQNIKPISAYGSITSTQPYTAQFAQLTNRDLSTPTSVKAVATTPMPGIVTSIAVTTPGSGYTSAPTISFAGGGGTGAAATATIAQGVTAIAVNSIGTGYVTAPTVSFTGGGGTGATATANFVNGGIPSVTIAAAGSGYTSAPTATITGGGGTGFAITVLVTAGAITGYTITNYGSGYTSAPTIVLSGGGGTGGALTAGSPTGLVTAVTVTAPGSGYTSVPTVVFTGTGTTTPAATATVSGVVAAINVTNGGINYTSAPSVVFTGGGGSGASATSTLAYLTGAQPIGTYTPSNGDVVLLTAQATATQNTFYTVNTSGAWTATPTATTYAVNLNGGNTIWKQITPNNWTTYVETINSTPVPNGAIVLFTGQTVTSQNGLYSYSLSTGTYTALPNQNQVVVSSTNTLWNLISGSYIQDTTFTGSTMSPGTYNYIITAVNSIGETIGTSGNFAITGAGSFLVLSWPAVAGAASYRVYGRVTGSTFGYITAVTTTTFTDYGTLIPNIAIQPPVSYTGTQYFQVNVYDLTISSTVPQEQFTSCTLGFNVNGYGQQTELANVINNQSNGSNYIQVVNPSSGSAYTNNPLIYSVAPTSLLGGTSGSAVTDSIIVNTWQNNFSDPTQVNVSLLINGGYASATVQLALDSLATSRGDALAILDIPQAYQTSSAAVSYRNNILNLNSNHSALYAPWLQINDTYNGQFIYIPPAGHAAAVCAKTDRVAQPWYAPAGLNRGLLAITGVQQTYAQGDRDLLQQAQVNYVRKMPGLGYAIMEAYTMQSNLSALSFIPVRRMIMIIEKAVANALLFKLWEPNDNILRLQIVGLISDYLQTIQNQRGLTSYLVVCDDSNNSPQTTAQGQLNVDVYVMPTIPAARISMQMVILAQGMSYSAAILQGAQR